MQVRKLRTKREQSLTTTMICLQWAVLVTTMKTKNLPGKWRKSEHSTNGVLHSFVGHTLGRSLSSATDDLREFTRVFRELLSLHGVWNIRKFHFLHGS